VPGGSFTLDGPGRGEEPGSGSDTLSNWANGSGQNGTRILMPEDLGSRQQPSHWVLESNSTGVGAPWWRGAVARVTGQRTLKTTFPWLVLVVADPR
jgi:hypothetical protein